MIKRSSNNWHENVLAAREQYLKGLLNPKRKYKITKSDLKRSRERRMAQVICLAERRFRR